MSDSNSFVPHPEAPKGTLPYGASPVYDHPQAPPGCLPSDPTDPAKNPNQERSSSSIPSQYNPAIYPPPPPPRQSHGFTDHSIQSPTTNFPPPPQRNSRPYTSSDDLSDPSHYTRNPTKLTAYLIPFPSPHLNIPSSSIPPRFMIYTPPPPPLHAPDPNDPNKEARLHKVQRKWQSEVRAAKTSNAKTASWKGVKSKATKGINWAMNQTTSSNLEFLGRVSPSNSEGSSDHERFNRTSGEGGPHGDDETGTGSDNVNTKKKNAPFIDEMILVYPDTMTMTQAQMREEFVNTMLRTKSKAQRDSIIATGLMPVAFGIDVMLTLVWPFGGLVEIDGLWGYASFRGAKTARSVTKRLGGSPDPKHKVEESQHHHQQQQPQSWQQNENADVSPNTAVAADMASQDQLKLTFLPSSRIEILRAYLTAQCHKVDGDVFPGYHTSPTESQVLEAIGWQPEHREGQTYSIEDEQWETSEAKEDVKTTFHKAAKEWKKYVLLVEENPEKAKKK